MYDTYVSTPSVHRDQATRLRYPVHLSCLRIFQHLVAVPRASDCRAPSH